MDSYGADYVDQGGGLDPVANQRGCLPKYMGFWCSLRRALGHHVGLNHPYYAAHDYISTKPWLSAGHIYLSFRRSLGMILLMFCTVSEFAPHKVALSALQQNQAKFPPLGSWDWWNLTARKKTKQNNWLSNFARVLMKRRRKNEGWQLPSAGSRAQDCAPWVVVCIDACIIPTPGSTHKSPSSSSSDDETNWNSKFTLWQALIKLQTNIVSGLNVVQCAAGEWWIW